MIKKLSVFLIICIPVLLRAQITMNVVLPPAGMVQKEQLWNLALVSNYNVPYDVYIVFNLQDAITGQSVLSGGTRTILLSKGIKMVQPKDVQPVQYTNMAAGFEGNFLPLGSYIACYTVRRSLGETTEVLANECVRLNITPLSPPLLNTPADKSSLQTPYPQFSWTPPAPLNMFDNLLYDINVAEIMPGQSPAEAILYNTPLFVSGRLKQPVAIYPSTYSKLEAGKTYAWQVTARNGNSYAAATEAWTFSVSKDSVQNKVVTAAFIQLKNKAELSGINYLAGNELAVKYYSYDMDRKTTLKFMSTDGTPVYEVSQSLVYGDNYITLKLPRQFRKGTVYHIEITDSRNTIYTAAFSLN